MFFDFDGGGLDHVGLVRSVSGSTVETVEGNTTPVAAGANGGAGDGAVRLKTRADTGVYAYPAYRNYDSLTGVGTSSARRTVFTLIANSTDQKWYFVNGVTGKRAWVQTADLNTMWAVQSWFAGTNNPSSQLSAAQLDTFRNFVVLTQ